MILIAVIVIGVISAFMSFRYGYAYRKNFAELKIGSAEEEAERILNDATAAAEKDAENIKKEKLLEAKEEIHSQEVNLKEKLKREETNFKDRKDVYSKKKIQLIRKIK